MLIVPRPCLLAFSGLLALGWSPARADDAEAVKVKLFEAKKGYDSDVQKYKKAVEELLDKREDEARKAVNVKLVDQIKAERAAFEKAGEPPQAIPAAVRDSIVAARTKLDAAYKNAVKEYLRLKLDDAVQSTEKERLEFLTAATFQFGKRTFLSSLKPFDIHVWRGLPFEKDTSGYKMNGEAVPHSLFIHPDVRTHEASVSYTLTGKMVAFRTSVGVPKHLDPQRNPYTPITFEVLGDNKSLWKSEPVTTIDSFQTCTVNVEKVKVLTLRIRCQGAHDWAHTVWFGPVLAE